MRVVFRWSLQNPLCYTGTYRKWMGGEECKKKWIEFDCWWATTCKAPHNRGAMLAHRCHENIRTQMRKSSWPCDLKVMSSLDHNPRFSSLGEGQLPLRWYKCSKCWTYDALSTFSRWSCEGERGFWKMHYHFDNLLLIVLWCIYRLDFIPVSTQGWRQGVLTLLKRGAVFM